jgi:hypothetical protein
MKVFVATKEMQGTREGDVFGAKEGEIVILWGTSFKDRSAMTSAEGATTTFKVAEVDMSEEEYFRAYS